MCGATPRSGHVLRPAWRSGTGRRGRLRRRCARAWRETNHWLLVCGRPTAAPASGRAPPVARGSVLDHTRVGAHGIPGQILLASVPVVLAVFERGIVDLD